MKVGLDSGAGLFFSDNFCAFCCRFANKRSKNQNGSEFAEHAGIDVGLGGCVTGGLQALTGRWREEAIFCAWVRKRADPVPVGSVKYTWAVLVLSQGGASIFRQLQSKVNVCVLCFQNTTCVHQSAKRDSQSTRGHFSLGLAKILGRRRAQSQ